LAPVTPVPRSLPLFFTSAARGALAAVCLVASACVSLPADRLSPQPAPIRVNWADPELSTQLEDGWSLTRCPSSATALCVLRNGTPAGHILMEDLPSIGEEATTSQDQIQATLAVRTQTIYQLLRRHRAEQCGEDYLVETARPRPVPVAGATGLRYEATGSREDHVVERTVGFRIFRDGIETLLETTAIEPGSCLTPEDPTFTVGELREFEGLLERVVAGSVLPPASEYADLPAQPGGSGDPRVGRAPTNGIGISHGLNPLGSNR